MPTILVAEDHAPMRYFVTHLLRGSGYYVIEADDGAAALKLFRRHSAKIDLVLTDLEMPGIGGKEFGDIVKRECPRVEILYMSAETEPKFGLLRKPFLPTELLLEVEKRMTNSAAVVDDAQSV